MEKENDVTNFLLSIALFVILLVAGYFLIQDKPRIEKKPEYIKTETDIIKSLPCLNSEGVEIPCKG